MLRRRHARTAASRNDPHAGSSRSGHLGRRRDAGHRNRACCAPTAALGGRRRLVGCRDPRGRTAGSRIPGRPADLRLGAGRLPSRAVPLRRMGVTLDCPAGCPGRDPSPGERCGPDVGSGHHGNHRAHRHLGRTGRPGFHRDRYADPAHREGRGPHGNRHDQQLLDRHGIHRDHLGADHHVPGSPGRRRNPGRCPGARSCCRHRSGRIRGRRDRPDRWTAGCPARPSRGRCPDGRGHPGAAARWTALRPCRRGVAGDRRTIPGHHAPDDRTVGTHRARHHPVGQRCPRCRWNEAGRSPGPECRLHGPGRWSPRAGRPSCPDPGASHRGTCPHHPMSPADPNPTAGSARARPVGPVAPEGRHRKDASPAGGGGPLRYRSVAEWNHQGHGTSTRCPRHVRGRRHDAGDRRTVRPLPYLPAYEKGARVSPPPARMTKRAGCLTLPATRTRSLPNQFVCRRCPTLPHPTECSTIGAEGLSFRVRNGTGRFPNAKTTDNNILLSKQQHTARNNTTTTTTSGDGLFAQGHIVDAHKMLR